MNGLYLDYVGTQTRTRSDWKYSIPERARRAIINYLSSGIKHYVLAFATTRGGSTGSKSHQ